MTVDTQKQKWTIQFIRFVIIGGSNVVVSYIAYLSVLFLCGNLFWSNLAGFVLGTLNSYIWNNCWVFRKEKTEKRNHFEVLLKMYLMYAATGILLNYYLLTVWVNNLGISEVIAPIINSIIGIPINFVISKFWCFRAQKQEVK